MKIGILTLPLHHNYGGILQAFALQKSLQQLGHEVYLIDRAHPMERPGFRSLLGKLIKNRLLQCHTRRFIRKFITPRTSELADDRAMKKMIQQYAFDAVVLGSDQVWRLEYSKGIAFNFFLDFVDDPAVRKIVYAASFGVDTWTHPVGVTSRARELLKGMDAISVREDSAIEICREIFGVDVVQVVDPTLLLRSADYLEVIGDRRDDRPGRLAVYLVAPSADKSEIVRKAALETGLKAHPLHVKMKLSNRRSFNFADYMYPKVPDWIGGFYDAEFVVTDSFHGVVFSLIFNKPFIAIEDVDLGATRLQSLLRLFGLRDRLVSDSTQINMALMNRTIDYASVNEIREGQRRAALEFLTNSLAS